MRFKLLFMAAASASLGTASAEPPARDRMSRHIVENFPLYIKKESLRDLGPLANEMMKAAGRPVIFVEPDRLSLADYRDFMAIPAIRASQMRFTLEKISPRDPAYMRQSKAVINRRTIELQEMMQRSFFGMTLRNLQSIQGGKNYFAMPYGEGDETACQIAGDLSIVPAQVVQILGSVPDSLKTEIFTGKFTDARSLLTVIFLHEAAHCAQNMGSFHPEPLNVLKLEIEADRPALKRYAELAQADRGLDPELPSKIRDLRRISPFLNTSGEAMVMINMLINDHVTADALEGDAYDADKIQQSVFQTNIALKALIYESLDQATKDRLSAQATAGVNKFMSAILPPVGSKTLSDSQRALRDQTMQLMPFFRKIVMDLTIAELAQKENPDLTYAALKYLSGRGAEFRWTSTPPRHLQSEFTSVLDSWSRLGLKQNEQEATHFQTRISFEGHDAVPMVSTTLFRDLNAMDEAFKRLTPEKPRPAAPKP